jgi:hypothetical protein
LDEATDEPTAQQEGAGKNPARFAVDALQGGQAKNAFLALADGGMALGKIHPMKCKWRRKSCAIFTIISG